MLMLQLFLSIGGLAAGWHAALPLRSVVGSTPQNSAPNFKVIALAEANSIHRPFVEATKTWLQKEASENDFWPRSVHLSGKWF